MSVTAGTGVEVKFQADDPDSNALCSVFAVPLGGGASVLIAGNIAELDGAEQTVLWTPTYASTGTWRIDVRCSDGKNSVTSSAPGNVTIQQESGPGVLALAGGQPSDYLWPWRLSAHPDGSWVSVGIYVGSPIFGAGESNQTQLPPPESISPTADGGASGVFIARHYSDGRLAWAQHIEGATGSFFSLPDVVGMADGTTLLAIIVAQPVVLAPTSSNDLLLDPAGAQRLYLVRLSTDGGAQLVTSIIPQGALQGESGIYNLRMAAATDGGAVLAISCWGTFQIGNLGLFSSGFEGAGLIVRLASDGTAQWGAHFVSFPNSSFSIDQVATDANGNVAIAGEFSKGLFPPSSSGLSPVLAIADDDDDDLFVASLTATGSVSWIQRAGGLGAELAPHGLALHGDGSVTVYGDLDLDHGSVGRFGIDELQYIEIPEFVTLEVPQDKGGPELEQIGLVSYLARFAPTGDFAWALGLSAGNALSQGLAALPDGAVVWAGFDNGAIALFNAFGPSLVATTVGTGSLALCAFEPNGAIRWARRDGGFDSVLNVSAIVGTATGNVVAAGIASAGATVGTGESNPVIVGDPLSSGVFGAWFVYSGATGAFGATPSR
ncbi:MAG: hypothetical protein JNJ88_05400 [Planctomycetes bacterium]|nr:hypothetical protein [Planctomycetota bacterium]